jgi:predicted nucleic acid-binding protein
MTLDDALAGVTRLGIDSPAFIYFIEAHPRYGPIVAAVFRLIAAGRLHSITSAVTPAEVLVHPLRTGDRSLVRAYRSLLFGSDAMQTVPIGPGIGERAAGLRARYRLRTPDALQLAASLAHGCEAFLTNDRALSRVTDLRIVVLDELEA